MNRFISRKDAFKRKLQNAVDDRKAAFEELIEEPSTLTNQTLSRMSPELWRRLDPVTTTEILRSMGCSGVVGFEDSGPAYISPTAHHHIKPISRWRIYLALAIDLIPPPLQGIAVAVILGLVLTGLLVISP